MLDITATMNAENGILQRAHRSLTSVGKPNLLAILLACQGVLLYGDFLTGPWITFSVFYLASIFVAVKYLGIRTAYVMAFLIVCGKTYVKTTWIPNEVHWALILWQFISSYSIYIFFCYLIGNLLDARRRTEKIAILATKRAGAAERKLLNIGEETQQRIGRELHDDLGQHITGIAFMAQVLSQKLEATGSEETPDAKRITLLLNQAISKTRSIAHGLYPAEMEEHGLPGMLEKFADHVEETYRIKCDYSSDQGCEVDDHEVAIHLFRITQEAVNNAVKHGHANCILLRMSLLPTARTLSIFDNGCGMDIQITTSQTGLGLRSMRHRAEMIGATMVISARLGGGTQVVIGLPGEDQELKHAI